MFHAARMVWNIRQTSIFQGYLVAVQPENVMQVQFVVLFHMFMNAYISVQNTLDSYNHEWTTSYKQIEYYNVTFLLQSSTASYIADNIAGLLSENTSFESLKTRNTVFFLYFAWSNKMYIHHILSLTWQWIELTCSLIILRMFFSWVDM